jgi:K+-sensing histidine kinase KdpD
MGEKVAASRTGEPGAAGGNDEYLDQLLQLADQERMRLVGMISDVEARGARRNFQYSDQIDLAELVARAVTSAYLTVKPSGRTLNVSVEVPPGAASVAVDAAAVVRMLGTLIVHADLYSPKDSVIRVVADGLMPYWGTAAARLRILGAGPAWKDEDVATFFTPFSITTAAPNDVGLDLLDAFQTALGHEGDIVAHAAAPAGPGFEVRLPLNPTAVRRPTLSGAAMTPASAAAVA